MKFIKITSFINVFLLGICFTANAQYVETQPNGEFGIDTDGNRINCHARSFTRVGDTYYMFGENRTGSTNNFRDFRCYASTDLSNWTFRGVVLTAQDVGVTTVGTRVDVLYNEKTQKYVMYFKSKNNQRKYGVASCSTIDGHYDFIERAYPSSGDFGDGTMFLDDDGKGYLVYSCLMNNEDGVKLRHLRIDELSDDFTSVGRNIWSLSAIEGDAETKREAPIMFKNNGRYYIISSRTSGWDSNQQQYMHATSLEGPWTPAKNIGDRIAYDSQASGMLTVKGTEGTSFFYAGDRWLDGGNLENSKYMLLPIQFENDGIEIFMDYYDTFYIDAKKGLWSATDPAASAIDKQLSETIKIFPNPFFQSISFYAENGAYRLFSTTGSQLMYGKTSPGLNSLSLPFLKKGIYYLHIATNANEKTVKIVKI